jgi:hypothetical protein
VALPHFALNCHHLPNHHHWNPYFLRVGLMPGPSVSSPIKFCKSYFQPDSVAHTCNPSYLEGFDWENHGSRPAWANILKNGLEAWLKQ